MEPLKSTFRRLLPELMLFSAIIAVYHGGIGFPVMEGWDDQIHILRNARLSWNWEHFRCWLTTPVIGVYMPLTMWSYMLDYAVGGLNPVVYHLQNLFWFAVTVLAVYRCFLYFGLGRWYALLFVAAYALHPQRVESVIWLSERKDVLCGALYFLSLYAWLKYRDRASGVALAWLLFVGALLAKPMAVSLPLVFLCIEAGKSRSWPSKNVWLKVAPFLAVAMAVMLITLHLQVGGGMARIGLFRQTFMIFYNFMWYAVKNFLPLEMAPIYGRLMITPATIAATALFYAILGGGAFLLWRRLDRTIFCWRILPAMATLLLVMAPIIGIFQLGAIDYADRYSYIPAAFWWFYAAVTVTGLAVASPSLSRRLRWPGLVMALFYLGFLVYSSLVYLPCWKDYYTLLRISCEKRPANYIAVASLGLYEEERDNGSRLPELSRIIREDLGPDAGREHRMAAALIGDYFEAVWLEKNGHMAQAVPIYTSIAGALDRRTLFVDTFFVRTLSKMALYHMRRGQPGQAALYLDRLIAAYRPEEPEYYFFSGLEAYFRGDYPAALTAYRQAAKLAPNDPKIIFNLRECEQRVQDKSLKTNGLKK